MRFFDFFGPWKKWPGMAPNGAEKVFVPTDILGDVDFDSKNLNFSYLFGSKFLDFQVPRFPKSGPGYGRGPWALGWARWAGPSGGPLGGPSGRLSGGPFRDIN